MSTLPPTSPANPARASTSTAHTSPAPAHVERSLRERSDANAPSPAQAERGTREHGDAKLPLSAQAERRRASAASEAAVEAPGSPPTILLVDDERKALLVGADILALEGWRVDTAADAREALEKFDPARHAAIVTDIRMPGLSGIELVERVRARCADVPIVILTGYATVETATRAVAAGAVEYLLKPVDFDRLKQALRRSIEQRRLRDENRRLVAELTAANARLAEASGELEQRVRARTRDVALQRDLLENVFRAIPTGVAVLGAAGDPATGGRAIVSENAAFARLRGAGRELVQLLALEIDAVAAGGPALRRDLVVDDPGAPGAEPVSWALKVFATALAGGRILLVADDVTDAVRVEDELVQVEKLLSLGTLAGGIVHDLANPLTAILGTAELLRESTDAAIHEDLDAIVSASQYMRDICSGLTEFARRAGNGEVMTARVNDVVERALAFARYSRKLGKLEVAKRLADGEPEVAASASELTQVLVNLVFNACDAMATAAAAAGPGARPGRLSISTERAGKAVRISVADSGPGIPERVQASMFAAFFTTKGAGKGTGLGLYTSRRIVKRLGGKIDFTTGPTGTTFTIELPAAPIGV